jgi:hypothetical protein
MTKRTKPLPASAPERTNRLTVAKKTLRNLTPDETAAQKLRGGAPNPTWLYNHCSYRQSTCL